MTEGVSKFTSYNDQSITCDVLGNPISYLGNTLTWTMGRQLASFGSNTYTYNEDGIRTSKTVDNVKTEFYLDGTNIIEQITGTDVLHFHYDSNDEVIGFTYNEADYFYVKNAMSDIIGIVDYSGNLIVSYAYDAWGKVLSVTGSNVEIGNLNPFRYRSYYYDSDIEMYYLQSRYYDPEVCRFINSDDVNYIGLAGTVGSYNAFAYCENNPVKEKDPNGCLTLAVGWTLLYVALCFVTTASTIGIINNAYLTSYGFQNQLSIDYNKLNSSILTTQGKINLLNKLIKTFAKVTVKFVSKAISVAIAEAKIKQTVTKKSKARYWTATLRTGYVDIGRKITKAEAIKEVVAGRNVFTVTKSEAKAIAKAAFGGKKPIGPEMDKGKENTPGYYKHFHTYNRNGAHVWYLF